MNKQNKGFTLVELLVVIGILGILMAALFPAISSAMLSGNLTAMKNNGKNLVTGIINANIDREANGRESVWPKNQGEVEESADSDIASQKFNDSDTYFDELFDMKNYGTDDYNPYVRGVDIKVLAGAGVPTYKGNNTLKGCNAWVIATDIASDMSDSLPVLVTRNMSTDTLVRNGTKATLTDTTRIKTGAEFPEPFGKKAVVVVYKSGGVKDFKDRYITLSDIYEKQTVTFAESQRIDYIRPSKGR